MKDTLENFIARRESRHPRITKESFKTLDDILITHSQSKGYNYEMCTDLHRVIEITLYANDNSLFSDVICAENITVDRFFIYNQVHDRYMKDYFTGDALEILSEIKEIIHNNIDCLLSVGLCIHNRWNEEEHKWDMDKRV